MSYEKVKIIGIRDVVKKSTGEVHHFLQVDLLRSYDIYLNAEHVKLSEEYKRFVGHEVLLPASWGEYQGRPTMNLDGDGRLMPFGASPAASPSASSAVSSSQHKSPVSA